MKRYLVCAALAGLVVTLSMVLQPPNSYNGGLGWDGAQYTQLAAQCGREPMHANEPFAYRVGAPCLAALVPLPPKLGLWTINILSSIVLLFLLDGWLRKHVHLILVPYLLAGFAFHWLTPLRHVWWYPTYIDTPALCAIVAALILIDVPLAFAAVCFAGVLVRESVLIVPVSILAGSFIQLASPKPLVKAGMRTTAIAGIAAGAAGMAVARLVSTPDTHYPLADAAFYWAVNKPARSYLLAWFIAFGPALALVAANWKAATAFLAEFPEYGVMLFLVAVLAWIGGSDTERFLLWGSPIVLVMIGKAADQIDWRRAKVLLTAFAIGMAVNGRWFLLIPDYWPGAPRAWPILTPWTAANYELVFSHTPDQLMAAVAVAEYVALSAVLFGWFKWHARS